MASFTNTRMDEAHIEDTWFPAMDPITIEEACELKPKTWSLFHDAEQAQAQPEQQNPPSQQTFTPALTETTSIFDTDRVRDSICVYKDRKTKSPRQSRRMPNELSEPAITKAEASDHDSTSLRSHSIRSQASSLSKAIVKKVAKSFCVFMLCTPPDNYTAQHSRPVALPAKTSNTSKITNKFRTFVDGESRYPAQAESDSGANLTSSRFRARSEVAATVHSSTTTIDCINDIEGSDPTNTPNTFEAPEAIPIFNTNIWNSARGSSSPPSVHSQASQHTCTSIIPLPPTPYLTPHLPDRQDVTYDHREWIPERDISPGTSIDGDGNSDCQTDVRRASDVHSQHSGWDVRGSVASASSGYSRATILREQSHSAV